MTAGRFLAVFAIANTLAVAAFSAFLAGGTLGMAIGVVLTLLALAAVAVTARIVVLAGTVPRERVDVRRLARQLERGER